MNDVTHIKIIFNGEDGGCTTIYGQLAEPWRYHITGHLYAPDFKLLMDISRYEQLKNNDDYVVICDAMKLDAADALTAGCDMVSAGHFRLSELLEVEIKQNSGP